MGPTNKIIVLVDMDCFYCQVEEKLNPNLAGKPIAVVQYNAWRGGGIIAVNYPARDKGVTRHMRGDEAKQKCPEIILARVPEVRGKADLTKYREAGKEVAEVLKTFTPLLERASVDEAYLDITDVVNKKMNTDFESVNIENMRNSFVVGWDIEDFLYNIHQNREYVESNCRLAMGGLIAEEMRAEVFKKTGYKCSAGIAHNKILAKVVCGLHKPNKQTILPHESVSELYRDLPVRKVRSLGGKFGDTLSKELNITKMGELHKFSEKELARKFDTKTANWLYNIARGIDFEPVSVRHISKSIGCCKKFPGKSALVTSESVVHWMNELASEITERLEKDFEENNRRAKQIVFSFAQDISGNEVSNSRTVPLLDYDQNKIAQSGLETLRKFCMKPNGTYCVKFLGISVGNFQEIKKRKNITEFFKNMSSSCNLKNSIAPNVSKSITSQGNNILEDTENTGSNLLQHTQINCDNFKSMEEETSSADTSNDENTSVYSATTDDLNEDTKSLMYYEDIYPESVASLPILKKCTDKSKTQHTSHYEDDSSNSNTNNESLANKLPSNSFFNKYFQNSAVGESCNTPKRDFDTAKILELDNSDEDTLSDEAEPLLESVDTVKNNLNLTINKAEKENQKSVDFNQKEACLECRKKIFPWEVASHMDYHYALSIVKNEAHLYRPKTTTPPKVNIENEATFPGVKRKNINEVKDTKPILAFLQKEELNDENSILCDECNKRIKLEEISSHTDYHTAKKLHLEINSCSSLVTMKETRKPNLKMKNKRKQSVETIKKIDSFFKSS